VLSVGLELSGVEVLVLALGAWGAEAFILVLERRFFRITVPIPVPSVDVPALAPRRSVGRSKGEDFFMVSVESEGD